jgi:hypothetical protein
MKLSVGLLLLVVSISSCNPLKKIHHNSMKSLSVGDKVVVENLNVGEDAEIEITVLGFLGHNKPDVKLCTLNIESATSLVLEYIDSASINANKNCKHRFEGKLLKSGVFEIYHQKKRIEIPPIIPIIYSNVNISRLRIGLLRNNRLAIEYKYVNTGNWFLLAAGSSSRDTYFFNLSDSLK